MYFGLTDEDGKIMGIETSLDLDEEQCPDYYISDKVSAPVFTTQSIEVARKVASGKGYGSIEEPECAMRDLIVTQFSIHIAATY